eukprot:m.158010 g.158010  ORF g.158010 m.158010 type:complete len:389 (+) comp17010_c2_seq1:618-1784(+)
MRMHASDSAHALVNRITRLRLEAHGRGLCHAICHGHVLDVHAVHHLLHDFPGARRAGHDARAQRGEIKVVEPRMLELSDKHGRHAVQAGAALALDGLEHVQGVEGLGGEDGGGLVHQAGHSAHDHAETVVQGDWQADAVFVRQVDSSPHKVPVVDNVPVGEGRALWRARRAARKLDVDRVVGRERPLHLFETDVVLWACQPRKLGEGVEVQAVVGGARVVHEDDVRERGHAWRRDLAARVLDVWDQGLQGLVGADMAELLGADQHANADLVDDVLELLCFICRVHADEHETGGSRGILRHNPLCRVQGPDTDAVARLQPCREEGGCQVVDGSEQAAVGESLLRVPRHHRLGAACRTKKTVFLHVKRTPTQPTHPHTTNTHTQTSHSFF